MVGLATGAWAGACGTSGAALGVIGDKRRLRGWERLSDGSGGGGGGCMAVSGGGCVGCCGMLWGVVYRLYHPVDTSVPGVAVRCRCR